MGTIMRWTKLIRTPTSPPTFHADVPPKEKREFAPPDDLRGAKYPSAEDGFMLI